MLGQRFYERCRTDVEDLHVTLQETELRRGKYKYEVEMAKVQCSSRKIIEVSSLVSRGRQDDMEVEKGSAMPGYRQTQGKDLSSLEV